MKHLQTKFEATTDRLAASIARLPTASLLSLVYIALFAHFSFVLKADPDLFARFAVGKLIALTGSVPTKDPFAFTVTNPIWYDHEWLSGVVLYQLEERGGDLLLFGFKLILVFVSIFLIRKAQLLNTERSGYQLFWFLFGMIPCALLWNDNVRARLFSSVFFALMFYLFSKFKGKPKSILFLPLVMVLWVNLHGGFVLALALHALFCVATLWEERRLFLPTLLSFVLCCAAMLVNPYGVGYLSFMVEAIGLDRTGIEEWGAVPVWHPGTIPFYLYVFILAYGIFKARVNLSKQALLILGALAVLGIRHWYISPIFIMAAIIYGTPCFESFAEDLRNLFPLRFAVLKRALTVCLLGALLFSVFRTIYFLSKAKEFSFDYSLYPISALDWLMEKRPGGKLLVDFNNGSFALWRLYPKFKISLDGRFESVYPKATRDAVGKALNVNEAEQQFFLRELSPDFILIHTAGEAFKKRERFSGYDVAYSDLRYSLLESRR